MKKAVSLILSILMVFALLPVASFSSLAAEGDEAIIFGDDNLRLKLCNSGIDTNEDGEISYNEILALNGIFVDPSTQITSLEGLQYAKNLQNLDITSQSISDWEPVAQLNKLVFVSLVNTNFSDILLIDSPELTNLSIIGSLVTEIPQEFNCNKLTYLTIRECELTDISGVANLTNLWHIYIRDTALSDISPLAALSAILVPQLTNFDLRDNQIEDISPLEGFKSLDNLILSNNKISTISKLPAFKYNGSLSLSNNEIEDLSVFEQFAGFWIGAQFINTKQTFDILYLDGNRISDITPLENIRAANSLKLDNNDITDISPILELAYCNQLDVSMNWLDVEEGSAAKSDIDTIKSKGTNLTYTPQKDFLTLTDAATGITVMEKDPHSIPAGAELSITEVTEGETFTLASLALESLARVFKLYDISLSLEGEEVQPSGKIRVTLPVPEGYVLSTASVYYINAFGKPSQVPSVLKNGSLVFELEHLSLYAVVDAIEDDSDTIIDFPDANLKAALIAEGVDANGDGEISRGEMAGVETLDLYGSAISNIEGLQYAVNLTELDLGSNQISNISPLANLTSLTVLSLSGNQISDLSPLANLTNLTQLDLTYNNLIDISPLANLTRLSELYLSFTQTSDISPISNLTGLTSLSLGNNKIIDISPLANLTSLDFIYLSYNPISDISPLANLTNLTELYLSGNQISSISPLANLTALDHLALNENQISDISLLANFTSLTYLYLSDNQISDISPLEKLTGLRNLLLDDNQIRDISPIANFKNMLNIYLDNNYLDLTDSYTLSIIDELIKQNDTVRYKPQKPIPATGYFTRFSGKNRAVTANAIATQGWPEGSDTVILASGASFADALAAAPLAAHYDAPILLTSSKTTIEDTVLNTIETLKAKNIIIIGGTSSVSKEIFSQLEGLSLKVDRLAGGNRYTTAIEVAKALEADGVEFTSAFLADGTNFPDALSVSPVAGILQQPILFTNKNDTAKVNADTGKYIAASGITEVVVIGGGISDAAVADLGVENTSRLSGANRYATAVAINTEYKSIFTGDAVTLTTGTNFPDALAGSAFSAKIGAPLFLVGGALSADVKAAIGGFNADEFYVYGGGSSLPDRLVLGHIF